MNGKYRVSRIPDGERTFFLPQTADETYPLAYVVARGELHTAVLCVLRGPDRRMAEQARRGFADRGRAERFARLYVAG